MRIIVPFLSLLFFVLFMASCGGSHNDNPAPLPPKNSKKKSNKKVEINVEKLYKTHCKLCHGVKGDLGLNKAKDLTKSTMPMEERIFLIKNGKGTMTPFRSLLSNEEIEALATYSQSLNQSQ